MAAADALKRPELIVSSPTVGKYKLKNSLRTDFLF